MKLSPLSSLRKGWQHHTEAKQKALRLLTRNEGIRQFVELLSTSVNFLEETELVFRNKRKIYLTHLQERLIKLNSLSKKHL